MTLPTIPIPGINDEGFLPLPELRRQARVLGRDRFLVTYAAPALHVTDVGAEDPRLLGASGVLEDPGDETAPQLLTITDRGLKVLRYVDRVAFLVKRPGNPFPQFVSLGRSVTNDVVISIDSISKLHGYFMHGDGGWGYTDHGSTNGSFYNDERLASSQRMPLRSGDELRFGPGITVEFLLPEKLWERVTSDS
ncbi:MAG: FHA domain-containing protein [Acidobacteriota bacterium]